MQNKWLSSWRSQDHSTEQINGVPVPGPAMTAPSIPAVTARPLENGSNPSRIDLPAFEEIYRSAGISGPRQGYTIEKIIDMLQCEHIRNLPAETKRASLLMALDAAGVQVEEVLHDANLRQHALTSHEGTQRKRLEEYEARKAQENVAIQAEADRVAAEYAAKISRNFDEVARERDTFRQWQGRKQEEAQRIVAAVSLCFSNNNSAATNSKPSADRMAAFRDLAAAYNKDLVDRS